jgi:hypothetical protein
MAVFDDGEFFEELGEPGDALYGSERTVQIRGVAFVAVMLVPCLIRAWGFEIDAIFSRAIATPVIGKHSIGAAGVGLQPARGIHSLSIVALLAGG